ncbi:hypothetical protein [Vibrio metschnikovii]|uniref:hypothetical protein n=1 Tax=Vibrio metschnikovii TaxID=28172 RepID=UPI00164CCB76|nr:hypothetical protein [Vibrio metschnikovii]MBC5831304.1 hypothetical protein [Vibrio metschnikovii]MDA3138222.1 hypothetical protein [Vibrio metschnikovii]
MHASLYMLEKELIENKSVTRIPLFLLACGILLFISLLMNVSLGNNLFFDVEYSDTLAHVDGSAVESFNQFITMMIGLVSLMLSALYFPKTFRKERKEGSAMFWRSMPVTNTMVHMVKLAFGLLLIPVICSLLVVFADIFLWVLNMATNERFGFLFAQRSLWYALQHGLSYIGLMWLVGLCLIPLACFTLLMSQLFNSPLLVMFIGGFTLKWLSIAMFNSYSISDFFNAIFHFPLKLITASPMSNIVNEVGIGNLIAYLLIGMVSYWASYRLYRTNESSLAALWAK